MLAGVGHMGCRIAQTLVSFRKPKSWENQNTCMRNHRNNILESPTLNIKECPNASRVSQEATWPCGLELFVKVESKGMS